MTRILTTNEEFLLKLIKTKKEKEKYIKKFVDFLYDEFQFESNNNELIEKMTDELIKEQSILDELKRDIEGTKKHFTKEQLLKLKTIYNRSERNILRL
jgi:hypothetical protein